MMTINGRWIGVPGREHFSWEAKVLPAPLLRRVFSVAAAGRATLRVCGLGFHEVWLNGRRVGETVLEPVVTHYDRRVRYVTHEVELAAGENVLGVILGNGWYNCHTPEVWHFDKAAWRDYPKLWLELEQAGTLLVASDTAWKTATGPIVFDALRNGETYDARLELPGWAAPGFDDAGWQNAVAVVPPGGTLEPQTMPGCRVVARVPAVTQWTLADGTRVFDFGANIAGWAALTTRGAAGTELTLRYGERLTAAGGVDQEHIGCFIRGGDCQTDRYILKGGGDETWSPRFTYHGFQYIAVSGAAEVVNLEACVVRTGFERIGWFECSDTTLNRLEACAVRAYESNFVGIPTDCPHREKNGWTGDAHLAAETGLYHFAAGTAYRHWVDSITDAQRPSGQLPGIVPSAGWGYNWGSGPAWDSALLIIPWQTYVFEGDATAIHRSYDAMRRYVEYLGQMADDHIVSIGLGDWCHVDEKRIAAPALTSTIFYHLDATLLARCATLTGRADDARRYAALATEIAGAFHRRFYRGDGVYGKGEMTALGGALATGLVPASERAATLAKLVAAVEANKYKADFGILGAKWIPRALTENGHAELAYRLITQPEFPGWAHWLAQGATTLWETWNGGASRNHIMFGDIAAWMFQYVAGLAPDPAQPGFRHFTVRPHPVGTLTHARATRQLATGKIEVAWERQAGTFRLAVTVPPGSTATVTLPDGNSRAAPAGQHEFQCAAP